MNFTDVIHSSVLLEGLNKLRQDNQLCDIVLSVGKTSLHAHKNVLSACTPYFGAMFNGYFPESNQETVSIQGIDPDAFELIINFIYTGHLEVNPDNVSNLLVASSFLQIQRVRDKCCEILEDSLDCTNCLNVKSFAEKYSCDNLCKAATKYAIENFDKVYTSEEFTTLRIEELHHILDCDDLYNHKDIVLFNAIIRWVEEDPEDRKIYLPKLIKYIHPALVDKDLIQNTKILTSNELCSSWITKASRKNATNEWNIFVLDKIGKNSDFFRFYSKSEKFSQLCSLPEKTFAQSFVGNKSFLYVQGGAINRKSIPDCFYYNIHRDRWIPFTSLKVARSHHRSCILGDAIYAIGGNGVSGALCNIERMDFASGIAVELEGMLDERASMGTATYENCIYVMGGENDNESLYSMERFDPRVGAWNELSSLNQVNSYCSCAIVNDSIYCAEGLGNLMERYDFRADTWELIEFQHQRESFELFTIENELYSVSSAGIYKYSFNDNMWSIIFEFPNAREWDTVVPMKVETL